MTKDEATMLTKIAWTADNWCGVCSRNLLEQLAAAFPAHASVFLELRDDGVKDRLDAAVEAWEDAGCSGDQPRVWNV